MYYFQPVTSDLRKPDNESDLLQYSLLGKSKTKLLDCPLLKAEAFQGHISLDENFVNKFFKAQQYFWGWIKESHRTHK